MENSPTGAIQGYSSILPPDFAFLFQRYGSVKHGAKGTFLLIEVLPHLEKLLGEYETMTRALLVGYPMEIELLELKKGFSPLRDGLAKVRRAEESRRLLDIEAGWQSFYHAAVKMKRLLISRKGRLTRQLDRTQTLHRNCLTRSRLLGFGED